MSFGTQQTHKLMDKPGNQSPPHTPVSRYSDAQKDPSWRGAALHAWGCFVFSHFCACAVRPSSITVSLSPASPQTPPRVHVPTYLNLREAITSPQLALVSCVAPFLGFMVSFGREAMRILLLPTNLFCCSSTRHYYWEIPSIR